MSDNNAMICNICGNDEFINTATRKNVRCSKCGSLERTRLFYLYYQKYNFSPELKVLHLAPEKGLYEIFKKHFGSNYTAADINPKLYPFANDLMKIDLQNLDAYDTGSYDLIIHVHVINSMPGDYTYTLFHLFRMLSVNGQMLCIIPFARDYFFSDFRPLSNSERAKIMGHSSIFTNFGRLDTHLHLGKIFPLNTSFDPVEEFGEELLLKYNIPYKTKGLSTSTVHLLSRNDCKLPLPVNE